MPTNRRDLLKTVLVGGATGGLFTLAGCSGGGGTSSSSSSSSSSGNSGAAQATVSVASTSAYGDVLVDSNGMSLYMFAKDTKGSKSSACSGACTSYWPPLTVSGSPTGGPKVSAALDTFQRQDGSKQVTAAGWPLYTYTSDSSPGDTRGQGVNSEGGVWYLLAPDGSQITSSGSSSSTSSGGAGYS